jgi:leucyl-tRNA synthetase
MTINGMLNVEGQKMSKSKGNFIVLKDAIEKYGADTVRITLMDSGEGINDINWTDNDAQAWKNKLGTIKLIIEDNYNKGNGRIENTMDNWLISRLQKNIKISTQALEESNNRTAATSIHQMFSDFNWYLKRVERTNKDVVDYFLESMVKILSVFAPFISEEIWEKMGKKGFISSEKWPEFDNEKVDEEVLKLEDSFIRLTEDVRQVVKLAGKNNKLYLYVVSEKELKHLEEGRKFLKQELGFKEVNVYLITNTERYDPEEKAKRAKFGKPGIYVE